MGQHKVVILPDQGKETLTGYVCVLFLFVDRTLLSVADEGISTKSYNT
jgi:hypothetical protein